MKICARMITLLAAVWLCGCDASSRDLSLTADHEAATTAATEQAEAARSNATNDLRVRFEASQASHTTAALAVTNELNGQRVQVPGNNAVYLIDRGVRRWIPNPETYWRLFNNTDGIQVASYYALIAVGQPLSTQAQLLNPQGGGAVYLVEPGVKRWVTSPANMDKYYFNWANITPVPQFVLYAIPNGPSIY